MAIAVDRLEHLSAFTTAGTTGVEAEPLTPFGTAIRILLIMPEWAWRWMQERP